MGKFTGLVLMLFGGALFYFGMGDSGLAIGIMILSAIIFLIGLIGFFRRSR